MVEMVLRVHSVSAILLRPLINNFSLYKYFQQGLFFDLFFLATSSFVGPEIMADSTKWNMNPNAAHGRSFYQ